MPFEAILYEVDHPNNVSTRLEALAEQRAPISEALMTIARNVAMLPPYLHCWWRLTGRSRSEYSRQNARSPRLDAELVKRGRSYERNQYLLRSSYRAIHDPAAPLDAQAETTDHRVSITKDVPVLRIDHNSTKSPLLGVWRGKPLRAVG